MALFHVLCGALLLTVASCQELPTVVATPHNVVNGSTANLEITCTAPTLQDGSLPVFIQLERSRDEKTSKVASQTAMQTVLDEKVEEGDITAEGALNKEEGYFLTVKINSPTLETTETYQCRFGYLDMTKFQFHMPEGSVEVTFTEPEDPTPPPPVVSSSCECEQVWAEIKSLRETVLAENAALKEQLKSYNDSCRASFSARISRRSGTVFRNNHLVIFDDVASNKGDAYDASKGIFTAPCSGQYFFQASLRTQQSNDPGYVDGSIEVNGNELARSSVFAVDHLYHYEQASTGIVATLEEGDEVQVRIHTDSSGEIYGRFHTVFTGYFISP